MKATKRKKNQNKNFPAGNATNVVPKTLPSTVPALRIPPAKPVLIVPALPTVPDHAPQITAMSLPAASREMQQEREYKIAASTSQPLQVSPTPTPPASNDQVLQASIETEEGIEEDVTADFPKYWIPPRSLREFHDCMFANAYSAGTFQLNKRQQAIVDAVFDNASMCTITFQQIKTLLTSHAIGASINESGGAHCEIVDPDGQVIPGGICKHGAKSRTYSKASMRIIQAQLLYLGLRPR
ncbi:MAG: hypothetical protein AAFP93_03225 [Bacteroidota bacterium]